MKHSAIPWTMVSGGSEQVKFHSIRDSIGIFPRRIAVATACSLRVTAHRCKVIRRMADARMGREPVREQTSLKFLSRAAPDELSSTPRHRHIRWMIAPAFDDVFMTFEAEGAPCAPGTRHSADDRPGPDRTVRSVGIAVASRWEERELVPTLGIEPRTY